MSDWNGFFETAKGWGSKAMQVAQLVARHKEFYDLFSLPREASMQLIEQAVRTHTPDGLVEFEAQFVQFSLQMVQVKQRTRAMELYAWLKLCETSRFQRFRGFIAQE